MCVAYKVLTEGGTLEVGKVPMEGLGEKQELVVLGCQEEEVRLTWLAGRAALGGTTKWFKLGNNNIDLTELS